MCSTNGDFIVIHSFIHSFSQSDGQMDGQTVSRSDGWSDRQMDSWPVGHSVHRSVRQTDTWSDCRSVVRSDRRTLGQTVGQSFGQMDGWSVSPDTFLVSFPLVEPVWMTSLHIKLTGSCCVWTHSMILSFGLNGPRESRPSLLITWRHTNKETSRLCHFTPLWCLEGGVWPGGLCAPLPRWRGRPCGCRSQQSPGEPSEGSGQRSESRRPAASGPDHNNTEWNSILCNGLKDFTGIDGRWPFKAWRDNFLCAHLQCMLSVP